MPTPPPAGWDIQPPSVGRAFGWTFALPFAALLIVLAAAIGNPAVAIGFALAIVIGGGSMWGMSRGLRAENNRKLRALPQGTLFASRASPRLAELRDQPRFAAITEGRKGTFYRGWLIVDGSGISLAPEGKGSFVPSQRRPPTDATVTFTWAEIVTLEARMVPGKFNLAALSVTARDGSHVSMQTAGYTRLAAALYGANDGVRNAVRTSEPPVWDANVIAAAVSYVIDLLQRPGTEDFLEATRTPEHTCIELRELLSRVEQGDASADLRLRLRILFAPTGELQDLSIVNGWPDLFIEISSQFDAAVGDL